MTVVPLNLSGQRFGKLVALSVIASKSKRRKTYWQCRCDCGREQRVRMDALRSGTTTSCGCAKQRMPPDGRKRHGLYRTPENAIWRAMLARCTNPNVKNYHRYGGRGITVCDRWLHSFTAFLDDMGPRPSPAHSIEREDNDGPYSPDNCLWATDAQQRNNKCTSRFVVFNGRRQTLKQWSVELGFNYKAAHRLLQRGEPLEKVFSFGKREAA